MRKLAWSALGAITVLTIAFYFLGGEQSIAAHARQEWMPHGPIGILFGPHNSPTPTPVASRSSTGVGGTAPTPRGGTSGGHTNGVPPPRVYVDTISGHEIQFTSTQGTFVGPATGGLTGTFRTTVNHTDLTTCNPCYITSGTLDLSNGSGQFLTADYASPAIAQQAGDVDSITVVDPGAGCTDEKFRVRDRLYRVSMNGAVGYGRADVILTHWRETTSSGCHIYSATVQGTITFTV